MRAVLLLCVLNFAFIGALPRIFFRRGRLNLSWWATAAPLFAMASVLMLETARPGDGAPPLLWPVAVLAATASIALIGCTIGVHRVPLSLWHQADDDAAMLVTYGPYAWVRHPFYAAFLLALLAACAAVPSVVTCGCAALGALQLHRTAVREEQRLHVQFGAAYERYTASTGRFIPRRVSARGQPVHRGT